MNTQNKKVQLPAKNVVKKTLTHFKIQTLTRHPSYSVLRNSLPRLPFRSIARFGSTTVVEQGHTKGGKILEINEIKGVKNSASKLLMKQCFDSVGVKTAMWWTVRNGILLESNNSSKVVTIEKLPMPIIVKNIYGSRGTGNHMCNTLQELQRFISSHNMAEYIIEKYMTFSREYRLHITDDGCFYTCRKMLKSDTPESERFQRHDENCCWYIESNPKFDKPKNWEAIVADCIKAKNALGLDILAFDVKVQSAKDYKEKMRETCDYIIIESCSAPSMAEGTTQHYLQELPKVAYKKARLFGLTNKS